MNKLLAITALTATAAAAKVTPKMSDHLDAIQKDGITADSTLGRHLLSVSRRVEGEDANAEYNQNYDMSFVSNYSIKFLGCHHVTQWATEEQIEEAEEQNDNNNNNNQEDQAAQLNAANNRIRSKGLVRFRLCPSDSCFDHFGMGCSSNYGEYVVDMIQFLDVYVAWQKEEAATKCATYQQTCYSQCYDSTAANCWSKCYSGHGVDASLCQNGNNGQYNYYNGGQNKDFDLDDYLECSEYEMEQQQYGEDGEAITTYVGPYCADQGGNIALGFFQDSLCSIASAYQASYYEKLSGYALPYSSSPLVSTNCMSCEATANDNNNNNNADYYNYDADGNKNAYQANYVNSLCGTMYMQSGKCESNMPEDDVMYPEEGACTYIESVKQLKEDGIIRADQKISSKPAGIAIGVFTTLACAMGGYVFYLKRKIYRSRVNLAGASTSLA